MTPLKLLLIAAAMVALLMTFATRRISEPSNPIALAAEPELVRVLKKSDRELIRNVALARLTYAAESKPAVDAVRIAPAPDDAPVSMPPVLLVQDEDKPLASRHRRQHAKPDSNVCTRHHLRKVTIGRSWRCRR